MANNLQDSRGEFRPTVTVSTGPNTNVVSVAELREDGIEMRVARNEEKTYFAGVAENEKFAHLMARSKMREKLLLDAVNNRTRERNYYILYSRLADGEITDEEFDRLLDEEPDNYVVNTFISPSVEEFEEAWALSKNILNVESVGDVEILFSLDENATLEICKKITDGAL